MKPGIYKSNLIKYILTAYTLLSCACSFAQYPPEVEAALHQTRTNRPELEKALKHFYKTGDTLKIRSVNFLIANMPVHNSYSYYWADGSGKKITYNEFSYASFYDAVGGISALKKQYPGMHAVPYSYRDIDSMKSSLLIGDVDMAVEAYRKRRQKDHLSQTDFLEYVLPYKVSVEPLESWRNIYYAHYSHIFGNSEKPGDAQLLELKQTIKQNFKNTYGQEITEPLPRLDALQILFRQKGLCEDIADMTTFIARANGIAATVDNIPAWGTTFGEHFLNFISLDDKRIHFDAVQDSLGREPAKVLRTTYSPQHDAVATWLDTASIPSGFLRVKNYKDVTAEYWPVETIACDLFPREEKKSPVVYACVFNSAGWRPVWYGTKTGSTARFTNMGRGVIYLPMSYDNRKLVPASWPYALGYHNRAVLKPDEEHKHSITLKEQDKYLKYRPGKKYRLFYWNNKWEMLAEQTAPPQCTGLVFDSVPKNALLILLPEYSEGKERPFTILDGGERLWW